jgi:hypothetical protein
LLSESKNFGSIPSPAANKLGVYLHHMKPKRYWLRGAIIGLIIFVLVAIILAVKDMLFSGYIHVLIGVPIWGEVILDALHKITGLHLLNKGTMLGTQATALGSYILMGIQVGGPILIGAFIGWIYGNSKKNLN